jgi:hypothetical protein
LAREAIVPKNLGILTSEQANTTNEEIVSNSTTESLRRPTAPGQRDGMPLLPVRAAGVIVTPDIVNTLRDEPA